MGGPTFKGQNNAHAINDKQYYHKNTEETTIITDHPTPCIAKSLQALTITNPQDAYARNKQAAFYRDELQVAKQQQGLQHASNRFSLHLEVWTQTNEQVLQTLPSEQNNDIVQPRNLLSKFKDHKPHHKHLHLHH